MCFHLYHSSVIWIVFISLQQHLRPFFHCNTCFALSVCIHTTDRKIILPVKERTRRSKCAVCIRRREILPRKNWKKRFSPSFDQWSYRCQPLSLDDTCTARWTIRQKKKSTDVKSRERRRRNKKKKKKNANVKSQRFFFSSFSQTSYSRHDWHKSPFYKLFLSFPTRFPAWKFGRIPLSESNSLFTRCIVLAHILPSHNSFKSASGKVDFSGGAGMVYDSLRYTEPRYSGTNPDTRLWNESLLKTKWPLKTKT